MSKAFGKVWHEGLIFKLKQNGPLLFLVYINDLENGIRSSIKLFADDTSLFSIVKDPVTSADELNEDLQLISQWALQWKMSFNPDSTEPV